MKKTASIFQRLLSMFLVLALMLSVLPVQALAALSMVETEELYLKMLDIGLVDENGALIEDNEFILPDGTVLESLDALKEVLCDENTDLDMEITVASTGKSATVEQIAGAIEIEGYMAEYTAMFNNLASGAQLYAANTPAVAADVPSVENAANHDVYLTYEISSDMQYETQRRFTFRLVNRIGEPVTLEEDYTFRMGLFDGSLRLMREEDEVFDGTYLEYVNGEWKNPEFDSSAMNQYKEMTIPAGQSELVYETFLIKCTHVNEYSIDLHRYVYGEGLYFYFQIQSDVIPIRSGTNRIIYGSAATETCNLSAYDRLDREKQGEPILFRSYSPWRENAGWEDYVYDFEAIESGESFPEIITELYGQLDKDTKNAYTKQVAFREYSDSLEWKSDALKKFFDNGCSTRHLSFVYEELVNAGYEIRTTLKDWVLGVHQDGVSTNSDPAQMYMLTTKLENGEWVDSAKKLSFSNGTFTYYPSEAGLSSNGCFTWDITDNPKDSNHNSFDGIIDVENYKYNEYVLFAWMQKNMRKHDTLPQYLNVLNAGFELKDTTAPVLKAIHAPDVEFRLGQSVPLVVEFDEPVRGEVNLVIYDGDDGYRLLPSTESSDTCSAFRSFLYEVQSVDNTGIVIAGINTNGVANYFGTKMEISDTRIEIDDEMVNMTELDPAIEGVSEGGTFSTDSIINTPRPSDNVISLTWREPQDYSALLTELEVFLLLSQNDDALKQMWASLADMGTHFYACVNGSDTLIPLELKEGFWAEGMDEQLVLTAKVPLPVIYGEAGTKARFQIDFYIEEDGKTRLLRRGDVGLYTIIEKDVAVKAPADAFTIIMADGSEVTDNSAWPSGRAGTINLLDEELPVFSVRDNGKDFTFKDADQFIWLSGNSDILEVIENEGNWIFRPVGVGTTTLGYIAKNGSDKTVDRTKAAEFVMVTVSNRNSAGIVIPKNANTFYARAGQTLYVPFSSNLSAKSPEGEDITVELYDGEDNLVWDSVIDRTAIRVEIPAEQLVNISTDGEPTYKMVLRTTITANGITSEITATAYIIVRSAPAVVTLTGLTSTAYMAGDPIDLAWTVENYDDANGCAFELRVEKDGQVVAETTDVGSGAGQTYSGSISVALDPITAAGVLKESYVVTVRAKNANDPTWSVDSVILTAYRDGSLEILVEDKSVSETTLKNTVSESGTVVSPTITNVEGQTFGGTGKPLDDASDIAALRSELGLLKSVSINYDAYDWSMLDDMIAWTTDDAEALSRAVTINYRQGTIYEPLENFSYLYYLPKTMMMLCGLRDGTSIVTAKHKSVENLSDTLTVNVERLKDKLYLFQFAPAVKTTVSYINGKGEECVVVSNSDGSLALYEESGIASDIRTASVSGGVDYRSTFRNSSLRSGEGNGTKGELYPLNKFELRRTAVAEILLQYPDGTPYANKDVTLRGGAYRNRYLAENRDDAYCTEAMFAKKPGEAAILPGTEDQIFTTDQNGLLTVYMDQTQFTSAMHETELGVSDDMEFVFELRFAEDGADYFPAIVTVDGSLDAKSAVRSAANVMTLEENSAQEAMMHIAQQTVDYMLGHEIDVRKHTGYVGPNANYDRAKLKTTVMLWGDTMESALKDFGEDCYTVLRTTTGKIEHQVQETISIMEASYPFSSIPLLINLAELADEIMGPYGDTPTMVELLLKDEQDNVIYNTPIPFRLIDMTEVDKIEESDELLSLMTNISLYGTTAPSSGYTLIDGATGILTQGLDFVEKFGGEAGLTRCILTPTEDPSHWKGYFWTGMDTTKLEDLNYDQNGICTDFSWVGESADEALGTINDTFTFSDFKAMADGSYFEDRSSIYGDVSSAIGIPIMLKLEGWVSTELLYNFEKGEWEIMTTGGGFSAGAQLEFEKKFNFFPMGIPVNVTLKLRGGIVVDFETAVRFAEQLGLEWSDETALAVNDYLTALRINAYFELFGGLGYDKKFTLKFGPYGILELNNENRFLTREYLKDKSQRSTDAQYLQLDGDFGIRVAIGVPPVVTEISLVHYSFSKNWKFDEKEWNAIDKYWKTATSGLESQMSQNVAPYSTKRMLSSDSGSDSGFAVADSVAKLQDRSYLEEYERTWSGGSMNARRYALRAAAVDGISTLQTNAYPYSMPLISDDGKLLVYLSDADSTNVEDIEVRYVQAAADGSFPNDGAAIPGGISGYADASLSFDGDSTFAGAAWIRESASVGLMAGTPLNLDQQIVLMNGYEVMASIWDGNAWQTTCLTENATQDMEPVIAVNGNQAIVAWRSTQTSADESNPLSTTEERVLYKIYDGTDWSEPYVLYNGSSGNILGLDAEMIGETATVALALDASESDTTVSVSGNTEIWYAVIDTKAEELQDSAKLIRATYNEDTDQSPELETAVMENENVFVLGWNSVSTKTGAPQTDIQFLVFGEDGAPVSSFPNSLSDMLGTTDFSGQFSLVKGADSITDLSVVWNDAGAGENNNDVLRAVKFGKYDGSYSISAPITVAEMPAETSAEHFDAYMLESTDGMAIKAVVQGAAKLDEFDEFKFSYEYEDIDGSIKTHEGTAQVPKTTSDLYQVSATYTNSVTVSDVMTDLGTLSTNTPTPITFTITNSGIAVLESVKIDVAGVTSDIAGLHLLPGQSRTVSVVYTTGDRIEDLPYTVRAAFADGSTAGASDVLYLDYPDVGISDVKVTREADGERDILVTMYNQSAADIAKNGKRRVKLGFYNSSDYTTPIDSKYFDFADDVVTLTEDNIAALDSTSYTQSVTFDIGAYITDAGYDEIPDSGVPIFVKAFIEENKNGEWIVLPEADALNNTDTIRFKTLLERSDMPVALTVSQQSKAVTTATVHVQNLSLTNKTKGNIAAVLLDENGKALEVMESYPDLITLDGEGSETVTFTFTQTGAEVQTIYSDTSAADSSDTTLSSISLTGTMLSLDSFEEDNTVTIDGDTLPEGELLLSVQTKDRRASVAVNGEDAEAGFLPISLSGEDKTLRIEITAADGKTTETYVIQIQYDKVEIKMPFKDVHSFEWFYEDVAYVYAEGLMNGVSADRFAPNDMTTRAMIVTVLWRLAGSPIVDSVNHFTDISQDTWYYDAVLWGAANGIVKGYGDGRFGPDDTITREQMVTMLYRYASCSDVNTSDRVSLSGYTDSNKISEWAHEAMVWACAQGVINGTSDSRLDPAGTATRSQIAAILHRYCVLIAET